MGLNIETKKYRIGLTLLHHYVAKNAFVLEEVCLNFFL